VRRSFERTLRAGELVFEEGDSGEVLFVIQEGQVELVRSGSEEAREVARLGPGEFFGEMAVLLGRPHTSSARALTDGRLLELDGSTFEAMCVEQPEIAIRVIQRLAGRTIDLERRLAALGFDDLVRPVIRVVLRRAEREGTQLETSLRELAGEAGLSLPEAHRGLSQLFDQRLLKLVGEMLEIPDLGALSDSLAAAR
jgi:CRP-like cAMP-binding protein